MGDRGKSASRMMARRAGSRWIAAARRSWALSGGRIQPTSLTVSPSTLLANAHASQTGRFRFSRPPYSRALSMSDVTPKEGTVAVTIVDPVTAKEGRLIHARIGASVLDVAQEHDMELEGACEGTLACSTCHCTFTPEMFDKLPPADEEELDMLDLAAGLTDTSRLGCQVKFTKEFEGTTITIPDEHANLM